MDDRLLELHNLSGKSHVSLNTSTSSQGDDFMPEFNSKIKKAQQSLEKIKDNNQRMSEMSEKYQRSTTSKIEKDLSRELEQIIMQNQQYSVQIKEIMAAIDQDVESSKSTQPDEPETQWKINQQNALKTKVQDVLNQSSQASIRYKTCVKEKMKRQTLLLDPGMSEDQMNEICNDPQKAEQLLQEKLFGQAASVELQNAFSDIQEKYKDIEKLERSVELVYQLFVDMAILVDYQGQMLDNIEMNLGSAKNYVGKANNSLTDAKEDHQSARKKMCCLLLIGVIIIAVIVVPIVATQ